MTDAYSLRPPSVAHDSPKWLLELADEAPESFWPARLMMNHRIRYLMWPTRRKLVQLLRGYGYTETVVVDAALEQMHSLYLESGGDVGHEVFSFTKSNERGPMTRHVGLDPWFAYAIPKRRPGYPLNTYYGPPDSRAGIPAESRRRWNALGLSSDGWQKHFLSRAEWNSVKGGEIITPVPSREWMLR